MVKAYSYVRLSSGPQKKGEGFRRQIDRTRRFAADNGLELDESLVRLDKTESAFRGQNATSGLLGKFLEACEAGQIEKGSVLVVESIDRISRQRPMQALALFMRLITSGITVVTLIDGRRYDYQSNEHDVLMMIGAMCRAYDESRTKSDRISDRWESRRKNASHLKMTAMAPAWLKLNKDRKSFSVIESHAAIVRRIFDETIAGIGMFTITCRLNNTKVPVMGRSRGWHQSYIAKILSNPAVYGELQPYHLVDGERKPYGQPISDYYPAIIERERFFQAQGARYQRRSGRSGAKGKKLSNLFTGLARCGYCFSRMHFDNHVSARGESKSFICEAALRKYNCVPVRWKYADFEASVLAFLEELDLGALFQSEESASKRGRLEDRIASLNGEQQTLMREQKLAYELLLRNEDFGYVEQRLRECKERIRIVEQQLEVANVELINATQETALTYSDKEQLAKLLDGIRSQSTTDVYKSRAQIAQKLRSVVSAIHLKPGGMAAEPAFNEFWKSVKSSATGSKGEIPAHYKRKCFTVLLADHTSRQVFVSDDDPLQFDRQLHGSAEQFNWVSKSGQQTKARLFPTGDPL